MDLFISYRRSSGSAWADLIYTKMLAMGVKVFYDKHKIENEDFEEKIRKCLLRCPNYMLILSDGMFRERLGGGKDWVKEELRLAIENKKNVILLQVDNFNVQEEFNVKDQLLEKVSKLNILKYINDSKAKEEASLLDIINKMIDANGHPFSLNEHIYSNNWYDEYGMTEEDKKWILTDYDVCHKWDQAMLVKICNEPVIKKKDSISLFVLKAYDINTYFKKYNIINPETGKRFIESVYGTAYESEINLADELFGTGHFVPDIGSDSMVSQMYNILKNNNLSGFDIIDLTLIIKDMERPDKVVREMAKALNPKGGVIFIRELDDDFVEAYPDEELIKKMLEILELDPGSGNRHTGKKIYTFLKRAGADKVFISDEVISTANHKAKYQELICDTYFSYLRPELFNLMNKDPDMYKEAYNWIITNYEKVEDLFCSSEFYFRAGFISGYGTFESDEDF